MALTMARYKYEGVDRGMVIEISFLGGFCVLLALAVSARFGRSLQQDAESVLEGTRRMARGERNVTLDTSRLDEFGAVASGINGMYRELESKTRRLETQLVEKDAMTKVSLAMSSVMAVDRILDLIVENAKVVTRARRVSCSCSTRDREPALPRGQGRRGGGPRERGRSGQGHRGHVAATGELLLIADAYADKHFDRSMDEKTGFRTRTLTAPMISKGQVIGVVQVVTRAAPRASTRTTSTCSRPSPRRPPSRSRTRLLEATRKMAEDLRIALERERNLAIEKEKMGAYVSKAVVDEIFRKREQALALGGKTVRATILFSDIKGFTCSPSALDPQEIVTFNVYMTAMTAIIEAEGAWSTSSSATASWPSSPRRARATTPPRPCAPA